MSNRYLFATTVAAVCLLSVAGTPAYSQEITRVESLSDLLTVIRESSPALDAADARIRGAELGENTVARLPNPEVMVTALPLPVHTARGEQVLQLRLQQALPWPESIRLMRQMERLTHDERVSDYRETVLDLRFAATHRLITLGSAGRHVDLIEQFRQRLDNLEQIASTRYEVGSGPQSAIIRTQVERSSLQVEHDELSRAIRTAAIDLDALAGRPVEIDFKLSTDRLRVISLPTEDSLTTTARIDNPVFERLERRAEREAARADLRRIDLRPRIGASVNWIAITESDIPPSSDGRDALAVGVGLRLPLNRNATRASIEQARADEQTTRYRIEDQRDRVRADIAGALEAVSTARRQLDTFDTAMIP